MDCASTGHPSAEEIARLRAHTLQMLRAHTLQMLRALGFTQRQAQCLLYLKLLYLRGDIRD